MSQDGYTHQSMYEIGGSTVPRSKRGSRGSGINRKLQREQQRIESTGANEPGAVLAMGTVTIAGHIRAAAHGERILVDGIASRLATDAELCMHLTEQFSRSGELAIYVRYEHNSTQMSSFHLDVTGQLLSEPLKATGVGPNKVMAKQAAYIALFGMIVDQLEAAYK